MGDRAGSSFRSPWVLPKTLINERHESGLRREAKPAFRQLSPHSSEERSLILVVSCPSLSLHSPLSVLQLFLRATSALQLPLFLAVL